MGSILAYPGGRGKPKEMYQLPHNKRMQSDHPIRYANGLAADARRYVTSQVNA